MSRTPDNAAAMRVRNSMPAPAIGDGDDHATFQRRSRLKTFAKVIIIGGAILSLAGLAGLAALVVALVTGEVF